jgi:hypothetical protein
VNDAVLETRFWGVNDDEAHPAVRVVQADGREDLAARINVGDVGDPFPGSSLVVALSDSSTPWLRTSDGSPSGVRIDGITIAGDRVRFDVAFAIAGPVIADAATPVNVTLGQSAFTHVLQATGGAPPYRWRAIDALPAGLTLSAEGIIQGAPEDLVSARFAVEVRDANGSASVADMQLRVTMPALTTQQALRGVADPSSLDETRRRALDLVGNRNGRLDVGDVVRFRRLLETSVTDASGSP